MEATVTKQADGRFKITGNLNRKTVMDCWPDQSLAVNELKKQVLSLQIDMQGVLNVDTAGLAWLMHLAKECQDAQVDISLKEVPTGLINLAKLSNVEGLLPLQ